MTNDAEMSIDRAGNAACRFPARKMAAVRRPSTGFGRIEPGTASQHKTEKKGACGYGRKEKAGGMAGADGHCAGSGGGAGHYQPHDGKAHCGTKSGRKSAGAEGHVSRGGRVCGAEPRREQRRGLRIRGEAGRPDHWLRGQGDRTGVRRLHRGTDRHGERRDTAGDQRGRPRFQGNGRAWGPGEGAGVYRSVRRENAPAKAGRKYPGRP